MDMVVCPLKRRDFKAAGALIVEGAHLNWYTDSALVLSIYSKYFWCLEMSKATVALGAYENARLVGVLLADFAGEKKAYRGLWYRLFVSGVTFLADTFYKGTVDVYDTANQKMLREYKKIYEPDGEICFFAADPDKQGKGIGTMLLAELAKQRPKKQVYLFTDSGCTYTFYDHRGFIRFAKEEIELKCSGRTVPLTCFLYAKEL